MGEQAARWAFSLVGLTTTQQVIVQRIAWFCSDETGELDRGREWLAAQCAMSLRSLERHLPLLGALGFVGRSANGFRLRAFEESRGHQMMSG